MKNVLKQGAYAARWILIGWFIVKPILEWLVTR